MRRLFIGVNFTNEEKDYFALVQGVLKKYCDRARYTHPENFHLTLKFLGLMPQEAIENLIKIIDEIEIGEIVLESEHIGFFSKKRGHIAYLGFKTQPELTLMAGNLNDALIEAGLVENDEFIYTPHITLCRNAHFIVPLVDVSKGIAAKKAIRITNITLYESINIEGVLTYQPIHMRKVT